MIAPTAPSDAGSQTSAAVVWHALPAADVASRLQVDPGKGLAASEAARRLQEYGPNALAEAKAEPVWRRFLKHYAEYMQVVLVVAALVSVLIGEYRTGVGLFLLTLFNAWLGYHQEGKAEAAAAALGKMMKAVAKVRRDGVVTEVPADQIVPGDIVVVDAGDRVPADGRVILAATLQIEEGALTGESVAVEKSTEAIAKADVSLGDRTDMAFMNTVDLAGRFVIRSGHRPGGTPIGGVMGLDTPTPGIMDRKPRPFDQPIIVNSMMVRLFVAGLFMAAAALILVQIGKTSYGSLEVGQTMALVGLSLMNIFLAPNLRFPEESAFGSSTLSNPTLLIAFGWAVIGTILITETRILTSLFHTVSLTIDQWLICLVPGVILLILGELFKVVLRARRPHEEPTTGEVAAPASR